MDDATTINAVIFILVVFVVLRYIVFSGSEESNPDPNAPIAHRPDEFRELDNIEQHAAALQAERLTREYDERQRRPVTQSMIEVVQAIAPNVSVAQIRWDLEKTGNIEATVERYLSEGTLPHPPKYDPEPASSSSTRNPTEPSKASKMEWKNTKEERQEQLLKQRQIMLEDARKKFLDKK